MRPFNRARMRRVLKRVFGLDDFRPGQRDVIESAMAGRNTLAVMPTGAGKSLCYQLPALLMPGMTIVVSPLIALMRDQIDKLSQLGVAASQVNSAQSTQETRDALDAIARERAEFVLTTPERLTQPEFVDTLRGATIDLVVIDEAHCISQWGHDFRTAYLDLGRAIKALGSPPVLALTATATAETIADIRTQLGLDDLVVVNTGIYRQNLHYEVRAVADEDDRRAQLAALLGELDGLGIVYCATVRAVEEVTAWLRASGVAVEQYHGRMRARDRHDAQGRFMRGDLKAMVATNAFGMGIDKPDIRFVAHYQLPGSLDAYYQESGRAGRDGEPARGFLLYHASDRRTHLYLQSRRRARVEEAQRAHERERLDRMVAYAQSAICRWKLILDAFDEPPPWIECGHCDNCERGIERQVLVAAAGA